MLLNRGDRVKKLLFVLPSLVGGGAERVAVDLINILSKDCYKNKFEIHLFTIRNGVLDHQLNTKVKHVNLISDKITRYNFLSKVVVTVVMTLLQKLSPRTVNIILKKILKEEYDVEIAFLEGLPIKLISKSSSKKIGWIHTDLNSNNHGKVFFKNKALESTVYLNMDDLVFVSETSQEGYMKHSEQDKPIHKMHVIKNILNIERIEQLASDKIEFEFNYICSVGRLLEVKGFDRLIEAYYQSKISDKLVDIKLVIIGSGPLEKELKDLVNKLGITQDVIFIPFNENPYKYIKNSKFFVSSSRVEGYPLVVAEALALEVPVVSTETGAVDVIGNGEFGLVVENSLEGLIIGLDKINNELELYRDKAILGGRKIRENNNKTVGTIIDLIEQ